MLILERKKGQSLLIGDNIKITIGKVGGNKVQFITKAPKEINIKREEIYTKDTD